MRLQQKISSSLFVFFAVALILVNFLQPTTQAMALKALTYKVGSDFNKELQCLAENVYYEAGSESFEGQSAVAQVTLNRTNSAKFPSTVCGVVKQKEVKNGALVCQFSWVCQPSHSAKNKYQWEEAVIVARKALTTPIVHDTIYRTNALYYHASYVNPGWNLTKIGTIGKHIFYKEKGKT